MKTMIAGVALAALVAGSATAQDQPAGEHHRDGGGRPAAAQGAQPQGQARPQGQPGGGFQGRGGGGFQRPQAAPGQAASPVQQGQPQGDRAFRAGSQGGTGSGFDRRGDFQGRQFGQPQGQAAPAQAAPVQAAPAQAAPQGQAGRFQGQGRRFDGQGQDGRRGGQTFNGQNPNGQRFNDQRFDGRNANGQRFDSQRQGGQNRGYDGGRRFDNRGGFGGRGFSYHGNSYQRFHAAPFRFPRGYGYRPYRLHERLPYLFLAPSFFLNDWSSYYLSPPPSAEYRWVRYGPDALLVDTYSGEVVDAAYGVFDDGQAYGDEDGDGDPGGYPQQYGGPGPY